MKVTIRNGKSTIKASVGGTLEQKLAFIAALTGTKLPNPHPTEDRNNGQ